MAGGCAMRAVHAGVEIGWLTDVKATSTLLRSYTKFLLLSCCWMRYSLL